MAQKITEALSMCTVNFRLLLAVEVNNDWSMLHDNQPEIHSSRNNKNVTEALKLLYNMAVY